MSEPAAPFHRWTPGPPLSGFVDFFWMYERYVQPHARERVLPTGTMGLIFSLDAGGHVGGAVVGARSASLVLQTSRPFSVIGVHFKPGGGFPFFGLPACELRDRSVSVDLVWGGYGASLRDGVWEAKTPASRFAMLERALLDRSRGRFDVHPGVRYALREFDRPSGIRRVRDVVDSIGMAPGRFADLFRSEVGLPPKVFCRIRRFHEILRRVEPHTEVDWADVALSCGYFDQAHFNHDFRAFAGVTPTEYLRYRLSRTHVALEA